MKIKKHRKRRWIVISVVLFLLLLFVLYVQLKGRFEDDTLDYLKTDNSFIVKGDTYISAHRAGSELLPEDTMLSAVGLIADIKSGLRIDVLETDLQLTKDGELILLHDDTLDRTTNAVEAFGKEENKVIDYTLAELRELNFGESFEDSDGNYPYKGLRGEEIPDKLRVCTVKELVTYLESEQHFKYILEIKDDGETGKAAVDELVSIIEEMDLTDDVIVASFHEDILQYVDEAYPACHRNASAKEGAAFYFDWLLNKEPKDHYDYDVLDLTPRYGIFTSTSDFGRRFGFFALDAQGFVNRAHKCNLSVFYWTVNDRGTFDYLKTVDADGIITDYPTLNSDS